MGNSFKLGELFSGAGGMALGAQEAKVNKVSFKHVWVVDNDKHACETFARNFQINRNGIVCEDVQDVDFHKLAPIDGLSFGFPCNDFSVVGEKEGISGKFGGLYQFGVNALKCKKPLFFVAENVSGIASSGDDLQIIKRALTKVGYNVFPHTYKFEEYGVPQARHRIILVGFRKDLNVDFVHPEPTHLNNPVTAAQALEGIPVDAPNHDFANQSHKVVERLKHIKPGQNVFTASLPKHLELDMKSGAKISQIYKRLVPDKPAYTVTGSGGGGTHMYHWRENRALTNRERARLQTFPDCFAFEGGREAVRKQIGMAVPPFGAKVVFKEVLSCLNQYEIPSQC